MFERKSFITESLKESSEIKLKVLENCFEDILKASGVSYNSLHAYNPRVSCFNVNSFFMNIC